MMTSEAPDEAADALPPARRGWRRTVARVAAIAISGALLAGLYRNLDVRLIGQALLRTDRLWLVISIAMILPITVLRAIRFLWVAPKGALPGLGEALRLTLAASALNVFLPLKAGDLIKSYSIAKRTATRAGTAIAIIVYERLCDLFGIVLWCLIGWTIARPDVPGLTPIFWATLAVFALMFALLISSHRAAELFRSVVEAVLPERGRLRKLRDLAHGWPDLLDLLRGRRRLVVFFSLLLWLTHLTQIWLFTVALSVTIPFAVCASLAAIALMAGQLPLTIAGLGTRDVALVVLLSRYMAPETAAAMGVLVSTRNFLPPLIGLPVMRPYLSSAVEEARRWRRDAEQTE
jgi:glycosyltransferase 2 family protein